MNEPNMTTTVPPLRQSLYETMACPESYVFQVVQGNVQPGSVQSERGSEVHSILAQYVATCAKRKVPADYALLDELSAAAGQEAGSIIDRMRDSYEVDWQHVYATEVTLALDADMEPTTKTGDLARLGINPTGRMAVEFEGTLDVILLNDEGTSATILDYKSHPQPFDPDTFQGMLYPFMLFRHIRELESIKFELIFVRYGGKVRRSVEWKRSDMPAMEREITRARARQVVLHGVGEGPALPGKHCQYCPKLTRPTLCSISEFNPELNTPLEERLRFNVFNAQHAKVNTQALKNYVQATGRPVSITDANGKRVEYGVTETEAKIFPLDKSAITLLNDWTKATGEKWSEWKLTISSTKLKSKLSAKKRLPLLQQFEESVIEMEVKPKFATRYSDGDVDTGYRSGEDEEA